MEARIEGPFDVAFRPLTKADLPDLIRWLSDAEVRQFYGDPPADVDEARRDYFESEVNPTHRFVIEWRGRGVGEIQYHHRYAGPQWEWDAGVDIFIGDHEARGHGVGIEAIRVMLRHLFEVRRVHRVIIDPEPANERAIHVYERAGFRREGLVRHHLRVHGEYVDAQFLAILDDEWESARAAWQAERGAF